jgi:hypothetical protein
MCAGYRAEAYGEFRDQSREVALKHSSLQQSRTVASRRSESLQMQSQLRWNGTDIIALNPPSYNSPHVGLPYPEDAVVWFFFKDYVLSEATVSRPIFNELPGLLNNAPDESALSSILSALGLVSLSNNLQRPEFIAKAHAKYAKALSSINSTLRDPVLAKEDHTLLVVMLLGLYEEV